MVDTHHHASSVSLVRQGEHRFYSLTLPSDLLSRTCFVINREENPSEGFQRLLDRKRAQEIAAYIDNGLGTIPSAIILSAQPDSSLTYDSAKKSLSFKPVAKAFLIIDGQHRVYGFSLAKKAFRIPVIIYSGLSRRDETRLFIDINSKQRGVPAELLLDIKKLAEYEQDEEAILRELFDVFASDTTSALHGHLAPYSKVHGMVSRPVFNASMKPLVRVFGGKDTYELYAILNSYLLAFVESILRKHSQEAILFSSTFFRAACAFFLVIAPKVKDRFGAIYTVDNFAFYLDQVGDNIKPSKLKPLGSAYKPILDGLEAALSGGFEL